MNEKSSTTAGFTYGIIAYGCWGFVPLYFAAISFVPPKEILAHRVLWSALLLLAIIPLTGKTKAFLQVLKHRKLLAMLTLSTFLVGINWYLYIYSVYTGQVTQGSLAYFILPIVNVFAGIFIFKEKIRLPQALALCLAGIGVMVQVISLGVFPLLAISLAITFCAYGVVRKKANVEGVIGLTVETLILTPIALGFLLFWHFQGTLAFTQHGFGKDVLILLSGVITTIPLVCFAESMRRLSFITVGFLQYLSPSLQLTLAIFYFGEPFTKVHAISFGLIWLGLIILVAETIWSSQRKSLQNTMPKIAVKPELALAD